LQRLANASDAAVSEDAEAALEKLLLPPIALDVLMLEKLNDRLCGRKSFRLHAYFLINTPLKRGAYPAQVVATVSTVFRGSAKPFENGFVRANHTVTPLKRGVNEIPALGNNRVDRVSG
jgi:hypothetical protein